MQNQQRIYFRFWPVAGQSFSRLFIFLGLPVLAWGPGDLAGFLAHPARLAFAIVVFLQALFDAWMTVQTPPHPEPEHRFDQANWQVHIFEIIFVLAAFGDRRSILTWGDDPTIRWLGLAIYLIGVAFSVWTVRTWVLHLRQEGERAVPNPVLLTTGPFRWIRYPFLIYLFIFCVGFAILFRSWVGVVLLIALAGAILHRTHDLDQVFAQRYPQAWSARCRTSKRILPFVY